MIYAICSKDQYRLTQESKKLIKKLNFEEVFKFDASDISEGILVEELCTSSLFGEKCIVIYHPIFLENNYKFTFKQDFVNFFNNSNPDVTLILLIDFDYDKNNELIKLIKKENIINLIDFNESDLKSFVLNLLDDYKIEDNALTELLNRCVDTYSIFNEIDKLKLYCDSKVITIDAINLLVPMNLDVKIYELSNHLFSKNTKALLKTYYDIVKQSLVKSEKRSYDINSGIVSELTKRITEIFYTQQLMLLRYNQDQIAEFLNVKRNVAYYKMEDARKTSQSFLNKLCERLVKLDLELKSANIDKNQAMELFLLGK